MIWRTGRWTVDNSVLPHLARTGADWQRGEGHACWQRLAGSTQPAVMLSAFTFLTLNRHARSSLLLTPYIPDATPAWPGRFRVYVGCRASGPRPRPAAVWRTYPHTRYNASSYTGARTPLGSLGAGCPGVSSCNWCVYSWCASAWSPDAWRACWQPTPSCSAPRRMTLPCALAITGFRVEQSIRKTNALLMCPLPTWVAVEHVPHLGR